MWRGRLREVRHVERTSSGKNKWNYRPKLAPPSPNRLMGGVKTVDPGALAPLAPVGMPPSGLHLLDVASPPARHGRCLRALVVAMALRGWRRGARRHTAGPGQRGLYGLYQARARYSSRHTKSWAGLPPRTFPTTTKPRERSSANLRIGRARARPAAIDRLSKNR